MKTYKQQNAVDSRGACRHGPLAEEAEGTSGGRRAGEPHSGVNPISHPSGRAILPSPVPARIAAFLHLFLLLSLAPLCHADAPRIEKLVPALGWDIKKQGAFPVSLLSDPAGNIWVGTEGNGLWKYDPHKKTWIQFTVKDGLGDDCVYALALDQQNRIWAGHLNHGVSVYNGDKWKNYGLLDGPIGDRVFSIAVAPKDGDVWIATDMGLARYSEKRQDWDYYTRASGLPSDQIQSVAFQNDGTVYAGTQSAGIATAGPNDDYTRWTPITAPGRVPAARSGAGLVSNLVNAVQIAQLKALPPAVAVLTPFGAAVKVDANEWHFVRGADWKDHTPPPLDSTGDSEQITPAEDWITTLATDDSQVLIGYRKSGFDEVDLSNQYIAETQANVANPATILIRAVLPIPGHAPLIAAYDPNVGGLLTYAIAPPFKPSATGTAAPQPPPPLPASVPPPALDDAQALGAPLAKLTEPLIPGEAYYLADDWRTGGDWVGRYGSGYVKLCGIAQGDQDYSLEPGYRVRLQVGPHHEENAVGPVSYHDDETSDDLRSLYDPTLGHRRDAQENDFSDNTKVYPESYDGPDLWVRVTVPDSVHCLSLYFLNNDAHTNGDAKYRDYDVSIVPSYNDDGEVQSAPPLAHTRVTDFWGGVYKQFLVCGPATFVVRIGRNRSFGTRLQGVFLDRVTGDLTEAPGQLPGFSSVPFSAPDEPANFHSTPLADAAIALWGKLDDGLGLRGAIPLQMPLRMWCYRAAIAGAAPAALLERWRWQISIWTPDDRKEFDAAMKAAREANK